MRDEHRQVDAMTRDICRLIFKSPAPPGVAFSALANVFTNMLASICPDCRRFFANEFRKDIPAMLEDADQAAAQVGNDKPCGEHGAIH
jgi:uncharacterized protein YejL (UPF0352 family)